MSLPGNPVRDALEVAGVRAVLEDDRRLEPCTGGCRVRRRCRSPEEAFLVLPVAVRPAGVVDVLDVQDRGVRAREDALALVVHVDQLDARAAKARACRGTHHHEPPDLRGTLGHDDLELARGALRRSALAGVGSAAAGVGARHGLHRRARRVTGHLFRDHVDAEDLVGAAAGIEGDDAHGECAVLLARDEGRHRGVEREAPLRDRGGESAVGLDDRGRCRLVLGRVRVGFVGGAGSSSGLSGASRRPSNTNGCFLP